MSKIFLPLVFLAMFAVDNLKKDFHHFYQDDDSLVEILEAMDGVDTISVTFQYDIYLFVPEDEGYVAYSEFSEDNHRIGYLSLEESKEFLTYWYRRL